MANYPKELLDLVQEYLTDGVISAKERQVLLNKAKNLGVDSDEFDLFIDAQEQKLQNAMAEAARKEKGKLCPFCQASVSMFDDKCPACGGNITPEASKEVEELINILEKALVDFKAAAADRESWSCEEEKYVRKKAKIEGHIRKAKMYYANNKTINFLVEDIEKAIDESEKKIAAKKEKEKREDAISNVIGWLLPIAFFGGILWWIFS